MSAPAQIPEQHGRESVGIGRFTFGPSALVRVALIVTALTYIQTITYGFVYDDTVQIEMNPWVQSWRHSWVYFTGNAWSWVRVNGTGSYYRPVFLLWMNANWSLFGPTPGWWHLAALAVHVVATALVYVFAARLLRDRWTAALAALIFGVYPLHIEAVSWISGIAEALVTVFFLSALLSLQNWMEDRRASWAVASALLYAAALLVKETTLAFLPVAAALVWTAERSRPLSARLRAITVRVAPYVIVTAIYLLVRTTALGSITASDFPRPTAWVVLTWPSALWFYLRQLCWPMGLSILYDFDLVHTFSAATVLLPLVASAAVLAVIGWFGRMLGIGELSLTWLVAPLAPVLVGIKVFPWYDYVHDRYLYLPSVMAAILIAAGIRRLGKSIGTPAAAAVAIAIVVMFSIVTVHQNPQWASDSALFTHAYERAPHNPVAADFHARTVYGEGHTEEAFAEFQQLLQEHPGYWQGNAVLGLAYYQSGRYADAEKYLTIATHIRPQEYLRPNATEFYYLGLTQQRRGALDEAEDSFRRAIEIRPEAPGYRMAFAQVLRARGDLAGADEQLRLDAANRKAFAARQQGISLK